MEPPVLATTIEKELGRAVCSRNVTTLMSVLARDGVKREISRKEGDWDWSNGGAPLHFAAYHGYDEMITPLLNAGIDVNSYSRSSRGYRFTALSLAMLQIYPSHQCQ